MTSRRRGGRRAIVVAIALLVALVAGHVHRSGRETGSTVRRFPSSHPLPTVSPNSPSGRFAQPAARLWAERGVTVVPPTELATATPAGATLVDAVPGIPEEKARNQLEALQRTAAWESWAIEKDQPRLLADLAGDPRRLGDLVAVLDEARDHRATVGLSQPIVVTRADLLPLLDSDIGHVSRSGGRASATAWRVTYRGPVVVTARWDATERRVEVVDRDAAQLAEGGAVLADPLLGRVWQDGFRLDCEGSGWALTICAM